MTTERLTLIPPFSSFVREYLSFAIGWVQGVCLIYALLTVREDTAWWPHFFSTWLISQTATLICFWGQYSWVHIIALIKKQRPAFRSWSTSARNSFIFLPLGIYLGVKVRNLTWFALGLQTTPWSLEHLYVGLILGSICIGIFFFLMSYIEKKETANNLLINLKELEIENLNRKLTTLSLQMNPHFLFNILNNLAESIHTNPDTAEKITLNLADLLRQILAATNKESHSLASELALCQAFINLEKIRYKVDIIEDIRNDVIPEAAQVPVMIIQPLLENAIRYGRAAPIHLDIFIKDKNLLIQVTNRSHENKIIGGTQTALENIKRRLELIYPRTSAAFRLEPKAPDLMIATVIIPKGSAQ